MIFEMDYADGDMIYSELWGSDSDDDDASVN